MEATGKTNVSQAKKGLMKLGMLSLAMSTIHMSFSDLASDILATHKNFKSPVNIVKSLSYFLILILAIHSIVSSIYGLRILCRNAALYPLLWGSRIRQSFTCLLHLIGLGAVAYQLDSVVTQLIDYSGDGFWRRQFLRLQGAKGEDKTQVPANAKIKANEEEDEDEETKQKRCHLESLVLIQSFVESGPQFLVQAAALFISLTNGTEKQCFPEKTRLPNPCSPNPCSPFSQCHCEPDEPDGHRCVAPVLVYRDRDQMLIPKRGATYGLFIPRTSPETTTYPEFTTCIETNTSPALLGRRWWAESRHGFLPLALAPILCFILNCTIFKWWTSIINTEDPVTPFNAKMSGSEENSCTTRFHRSLYKHKCTISLLVLMVACFCVYPLVIPVSKSLSSLKTSSTLEDLKPQSLPELPLVDNDTLNDLFEQCNKDSKDQRQSRNIEIPESSYESSLSRIGNTIVNNDEPYDDAYFEEETKYEHIRLERLRLKKLVDINEQSQQSFDRLHLWDIIVPLLYCCLETF